MGKKIIAGVFAAVLAISCSSDGNRKSVTMEKDVPTTVATADNMMSENMAGNATTDENGTDKMEMSENGMAENMKRTYICGKATIMVESTDDSEEVTLTDRTGTHRLKRSVSGSGELYKDSKGLSIHMKGDEAVYKASAKAKDVSCKTAE